MRMLRTLLACAIGTFSVACGARPSSGDTSGSSPTTTFPSSARVGPTSDTAFVELRRYESQGVKSPQGGCRWSGKARAPDDTLRGVMYAERTLSVDGERCKRVVAFGYWKGAPPTDDTTGYGEDTKSASFPPRAGRARSPGQP
jgi:hypothetical protein